MHLNNKATHKITLAGFAIENGKIPFSMLNELSEHLLKVAGGALRLYVDGNSQAGPGKEPEWLKKSLDFHLVGLKNGSTVLEVEAPLLKETLSNAQFPLTDLLDKHLLKEMMGFKKFLSDDARISIDFANTGKQIVLEKENISRIKALEESTPKSIKIKLTGKLDVMRHTRSQLEIITPDKRIRATLAQKFSIDEAKSFFGQEITVTGIANYNPAGQITSIELQTISKANENDTFFKTTVAPLQQQVSLKLLAKEKKYKGSDLDKVVGKWPGEETIEELLSMVHK
jgi:hypothetical protein